MGKHRSNPQYFKRKKLQSEIFNQFNIKKNKINKHNFGRKKKREKEKVQKKIKLKKQKTKNKKGKKREEKMQKKKKEKYTATIKINFPRLLAY